VEYIINNIVWVLLGIVVIVLAAGIRIANEHERFIVIALGRYAGFKGPGLLLKWPSSSVVWHRVALNDEGQYLGDGLIKVRDVVFPAEDTEQLKTGDKVKISSFGHGKVAVMRGS
jgi:regulator of protease activity HflC (stomatin/prohibitin superfamily)